jgi:Leucine-rich repeat (LRR) protein
MRSLFEKLFLPSALLVLLTQCEKEPEPINISVPDDAFLNALIELGVDANGDGMICTCEAEKITSLDINSREITDLSGIEEFINLRVLHCGFNLLTSLDVSKNRELIELWCGANKLTNLDISNNSHLRELLCDGNQLTQLDISNNTALVRLFCSGNPITSLDASQNTAITELYCNENQLAGLDFSKNKVSPVFTLVAYYFQIFGIAFIFQTPT